MTDEKLLTIRDVSLLLGISEKEVMDMADSGAIPAYKIGGVYVRFKRHEVETYKKKFMPKDRRVAVAEEYSLTDRLSDFLYFNDFYILAVLIVLFMLVVIFRG